MTGPDCVVMCNLINIHTHTHWHTVALILTVMGQEIDFNRPMICDKHMATVSRMGVGNEGRTRNGPRGYLKRQRLLLEPP